MPEHTVGGAEPPARWERLRRLLSAEPVPLPELVARLRAEDPDVTADEVERELRASGDVVGTEAGWVSLLVVADGVVLTHLLSQEEKDASVLAADGDLDLWARLADEGLPFASGGEVRTRWGGGPESLPPGASAALAGPSGWLEPFTSGQMLALRLQDGALTVDALTELEPDVEGADRATRLVEHCTNTAAEGLAGYLQAEDPEDTAWVLLDDALASLVAEEPRILATPMPPLSWLLTDAGLQFDGGFLALPGVPSLRELPAFETGEIQALVLAHAGLGLLARGEAADQGTARWLFAALRLPVVAERVADAVELDPLPPPAVDVLLRSARSDEERGHALLLAARSTEGSGDYVTAERLLGEAVRLVPTCWPVAVDAAQYAAARGDVVRADSVLAKAGVRLDDPMREALRPLTASPEGLVPRKQPCPCGSGRKYKHCCLRGKGHSLTARAPLAYARLVVHAQRPGLFDEAGRFVHLVDRENWALALDLGLFEGGALEDYLDCRGHLLLPDERELLESWRGTPLMAYEVIDVQSGRQATVRPLPDGEPIVLTDRAFSTCVERLDVLLARLVSDGEKPALLALPTPVHRMHRAALLEILDGGDYDPDRLAAFFGPRRPPKLRTRDGEDLVFCEAVYDPRDHDGSAWERLRQQMGQDEEDPNRLVLAGRKVAEDEYLLRGSVTRDGDRWTVETNSVERFAELKQLVMNAAQNGELVTESTRSADEVLAAHRTDGPDDADRSASDVSRDMGLTPEQEAALLQEYMRSHEKQWIEDAIPALGGRSPRQAVAEGGAALRELEAMLADMEWMNRQSGQGMDPGRIRRHLGLATGAAV